MENCIQITDDGRQFAVKKGQGREKFIDVSSGLSATSSGAVLKLSGITQGAGISQRTGDAVYLKRMFLNYTLATQNADVFNTSRIIIFQWIPNDGLVAPVVADILQSANLYSMYNFQLSSQFVILYDRLHCQSGITSAPASSGNSAYFGPINFSVARPRVDFSAGSAFQCNSIYLLDISDSALAPFPSGNVVSRIIYTED